MVPEVQVSYQGQRWPRQALSSMVAPWWSETPLLGACLASMKGTFTLLQLLLGLRTLCASVSSPENQGWVLLAQGLALETRACQGREYRGVPAREPGAVSDVAPPQRKQAPGQDCPPCTPFPLE